MEERTYHDRQVLGSVTGINTAVVVQVVPLPSGEVCWNCVGALQQDGSHHDGISQHPLPVDEDRFGV